VLAAVVVLAALAIPAAPAAHVNDYAHVLGAADQQALERRLTEQESATGTQMVIAIFPSLEGESLEDYSIRLAQQWRIGQKQLDNGVILLVFVAERKVRLEVGYGLESVVTDAVSAQVIRESIAPRFREGRYAAGLDAAVGAVYARIRPGEGPRAKAAPATGGAPSLPVVGFFAILGVIAFILLREAFSAQSVARRNVYTAGGRGWQAPVIFPVPWWRGGGGGFGSGGGGFGGGGGFSGGGGSFGGGGASGDW